MASTIMLIKSSSAKIGKKETKNIDIKMIKLKVQSRLKQDGQQRPNKPNCRRECYLEEYVSPALHVPLIINSSTQLTYWDDPGVE